VLRTDTKSILTVLLVGTALAASMAACGGRQGTATATPSTSSVHTMPGPVALEYMRDITRSDLKAASLLVSPSQRGMVDAIALGNGRKNSLPHMSGELSIGKISEDGDTATVSLLGKMCRSESVKSTTECIENDDPITPSPAFLVRLKRNVKSEWEVYFDLAPSGNSPTSS
jgi:hypothetical protein